MASPKNYERARSREDHNEYSSNSSYTPFVWRYTGTARPEFEVRVAKRKTEPVAYVVETYNFRDRDEVDMFKEGFTNKEVAREYAVEWMREHPRP